MWIVQYFRHLTDLLLYLGPLVIKRVNPIQIIMGKCSRIAKPTRLPIYAPWLKIQCSIRTCFVHAIIPVNFLQSSVSSHGSWMPLGFLVCPSIPPPSRAWPNFRQLPVLSSIDWPTRYFIGTIAHIFKVNTCLFFLHQSLHNEHEFTYFLKR